MPCVTQRPLQVSSWVISLGLYVDQREFLHWYWNLVQCQYHLGKPVKTKNSQSPPWEIHSLSIQVDSSLCYLSLSGRLFQSLEVKIVLAELVTGHKELKKDPSSQWFQSSPCGPQTKRITLNGLGLSSWGGHESSLRRNKGMRSSRLQCSSTAHVFLPSVPNIFRLMEKDSDTLAFLSFLKMFLLQYLFYNKFRFHALVLS